MNVTPAAQTLGHSQYLKCDYHRELNEVMKNIRSRSLVVN